LSTRMTAAALGFAALPPDPPITMVAPVGPPATINCEPRQARKGAAAAVASGAGARPIGAATLT